MRRLRSTFVLAALSLTACTGEIADTSADAETEAALASCSSSQYATALAAYQRAVAWSKERLREGVCESENGYQWGIADEASRAVMTCGGFRETIRTSVYAKPLREVLASSLTLRSLTGELLVIKDSAFQNWNGVEKHFSSGLTFWARGVGAYGPPVTIEFRADGKATYGALVHDPVTDDISWGQSAATYRIERTTGRAQDKRRVIVEHGGTTETYLLQVENPTRYKDAPIFVLQPSTPDAPALYSLTGECEA